MFLYLTHVKYCMYSVFMLEREASKAQAPSPFVSKCIVPISDKCK